MKAAMKMANQYNARNAAKFKDGDLVTIRIPNIDCTSTDMPRLPCLVVEGAWKSPGVISSQVNLSESIVAS